VTAGIYIHIPFCASKCFYCDFLSFADAPENLIADYKNALINEILKYKKGVAPVTTVYIGGGTPTGIPLDFLLGIISAVKTYPLADGLEFTVETNPGTASLEYLAALKNAGANRLSIGLQTTDDKLLKQLGRIHTYNDFLNGYAAARRAGFTNISVDMMYALPGQTTGMLRDGIKRVVALKPEHISAYPLTIEKGTAFERVTPADDDTEIEMYDIIKKALTNAGYCHYEISNYAMPGFISRHNTAYWRRENYLGFGAGAHSFAGNVRYSNTRVLRDYIKSDNPVVSSENINKTDAMEEFFFLGLRLIQGVDLREFYNAFKISAFDVYGNKIQRLIAQGLLEWRGENILRLTDRAVCLSNYVFKELLT